MADCHQDGGAVLPYFRPCRPLPAGASIADTTRNLDKRQLAEVGQAAVEDQRVDNSRTQRPLAKRTKNPEKTVVFPGLLQRGRGDSNPQPPDRQSVIQQI